VIVVRVIAVIDSHNICGDTFASGRCCNDHLFSARLNVLLSLDFVCKLSGPLHHCRLLWLTAQLLRLPPQTYNKAFESPYLDDKVDTELSPWQLRGVFLRQNRDLFPIHLHEFVTIPLSFKYTVHLAFKFTIRWVILEKMSSLQSHYKIELNTK